jgi:predicted alpha/beta superfamily hydrolase
MKTFALGFVAMLATLLSASARTEESGTVSTAATPLAEHSEGSPVTIPQAQQFDFVSRINGRTYRLFVAAPAAAASGKALPVFYVLDGNWFFGTAAAISSGAQLDALVVGIGYPTDRESELNTRRIFELTPVADPAAQNPSGGGDALARVILEEVKPFIDSRFKTAPGRRAIFGYSHGGLLVLRILFRHPEAFDTFVAGSPSIWWKNRVILDDEESFAQRARTSELHLRLLITSGELEQYRGDDGAKLVAANRNRMVDNASELAARLGALAPQNVVVTRQIIADERHVSGAVPALVRGLFFATRDPSSR